MANVLAKPPIKTALGFLKEGQTDQLGNPAVMLDHRWAQWLERVWLLLTMAGDPAMGSICTDVAAETSISTVSTFVKVAGTTTTLSLRSFDMPADNRLRYIGTERVHLHIACSISMTTAANNKQTEFRMYFYDDSAGSGTVHESSKTIRHVSTGADVDSTALHWDTMCDQNDYIELWGANNTDSTNLTVEWMYLFALAMPALQ